MFVSMYKCMFVSMYKCMFKCMCPFLLGWLESGSGQFSPEASHIFGPWRLPHSFGYLQTGKSGPADILSDRDGLPTTTEHLDALFRTVNFQFKTSFGLSMREKWPKNASAGNVPHSVVVSTVLWQANQQIKRLGVMIRSWLACKRFGAWGIIGVDNSHYLYICIS